MMRMWGFPTYMGSNAGNDFILPFLRDNNNISNNIEETTNDSAKRRKLENDIEEQSNEIFNIKNLLDNEIENSNKTQKANE